MECLASECFYLSWTKWVDFSPNISPFSFIHSCEVPVSSLITLPFLRIAAWVACPQHPPSAPLAGGSSPLITQGEVGFMKTSRLPGDTFHGTRSSCCWQVQRCPGSKAETFHTLTYPLLTLPSDAQLPGQDCQIIRAFVFLVVTKSWEVLKGECVPQVIVSSLLFLPLEINYN